MTTQGGNMVGVAEEAVVGNAKPATGPVGVTTTAKGREDVRHRVKRAAMMPKVPMRSGEARGHTPRKSGVAVTRSHPLAVTATAARHACPATMLWLGFSRP